MKIIKHTFTFQHVPPGFKRGKLAVLALFKDSRLLLARKHAYPEGIYRIFGGGVDAGENIYEAALRELKEETGITAKEEDVDYTAHFDFELTEKTTGSRFEFDIDLFYVDTDSNNVIPSDDVDELGVFDRIGLEHQIEQMRTLASDVVEPKQDGQKFSWSDWGMVFSIVHEYVLKNWPN